MAERILVNTEQIQATVQNYETAKERKLASIDAMIRAMADIDWEGQAFQSYKAKFEALVANLRTSELVMDDAIKELNVAIEEYIQAEQTNIARAESIDAGIPGMS